LIVREFPELLAFEADNLVPNPPDAIKPDGTLDEEKLKGFKGVSALVKKEEAEEKSLFAAQTLLAQKNLVTS
jgi:hypothetical protein